MLAYESSKIGRQTMLRSKVGSQTIEQTFGYMQNGKKVLKEEQIKVASKNCT